MRATSNKPHQSLRLFENDLLEKLSHVHPITPLVVWAPVVIALIWHSLVVRDLSVGRVAGLGALGLFVWTLTEYILHRYVFHFVPKGKFLTHFQFIIHGNHHDDPNDPTRLVMPPAASLILAVIFYSLFRAILGEADVEPFFAFFVIGYLCYDYIHFAVHHFTPRTPIGKYLKKVHMVHHFVNHDTHWGVSSPVWDVVFGTLHSPKKAASRGAGAG